MKKHYYTNGVSTIKVEDGQKPPDGFYKGRTFKSNPWNKGLTKESSEKVLQYSIKASDTKQKKNYCSTQ